MPNLRQGFLNSYVLLKGESNYGTPATGTPKKVIYELADAGANLVKIADPIVPVRYTRYGAPIKNILGRISAAGTLNFQLHGNYMGSWFFRLFGDGAPVSVASDNGQCATAGANDPNVRAVSAGSTTDKAVTAATMSVNTQPNNTANPKLAPAKLQIKTWDATGAANGTWTGTVKVAGTDQLDQAISETFTFTSANTVTGTKYFKTIDASGITITVTSGLTLGTHRISIEAQKGISLHSFVLKDADQQSLTLEYVKGGDPNTYDGCLLNTGNITLAPVITASFDILARNGKLRKNIAGGSSATSLSTFVRVPEDVFPNWGWSAVVGGTQMELNSSVFTVNNNLAFPDRVNGQSNGLRRLQARPQRTAAQDVTIALNAAWDTAKDFDTNYENDDDVTLKLVGYALPSAGPEYLMHIEALRAKLTSYPDPAVDTYADLNQNLNFKLLPHTGTTVTVDVGWDASGYGGVNRNPSGVSGLGDVTANDVPAVIMVIQSTEADLLDGTPA